MSQDFSRPLTASEISDRRQREARVLNKTLAIARNDACGAQPEERRRLIFGASELLARLMLIDLSEAEYEAGNHFGSVQLWHAEMYLADRIGYEMNPPPTKMSVPMMAEKAVASQEPSK